MTFYVIATPIGNLEDITFRAVRLLKEVDLILCEDTRVTKRLMAKYGINTVTMSYHSQSKLSKIDKILDMIEEGKTLALVSDAGTPTISDPGSLLISKIRERFPEIKITPVPGAAALAAALSVSGLPASDFLFLGFLPHKKGRETLFKEVAASRRPTVFYESPHRILKTLEALGRHLSAERQIVIARELTKIYEEIVSGTSSEILLYFQNNPDKVRGEFVVIVEAKK
ncbi:MAG TPA: 16S rRNA (cytidine(1402)-2'-O)-methyltransferase [Candidatus Paceibacterota bacterium]|nr:16S rRNA (cytidine(1402)-2'-O)-methyltransferase [Candidatus Paceibacterota bacterium]